MTSEELLAAYRTDTAPGPDRDDALFDAIVRRIVTTDDQDLVDAVCGPDEEFEELEDDFEAFEDDFEEGASEDESSANTSPQAVRRPRSVVLPVALATAAVAAGLVLALSVRGELLSPASEMAPWQAPNVEEAELPWWRRIVPRRLLDGEVEPDSAVDASDAESDESVALDDAPTHVVPRPAAATPESSGSPGEASGVSVGSPEPAAAAVVPDPAAGWGAPLYDPRPAGPKPGNKPAGAVGGAYPGGGGGSTKPSKKDDSGQKSGDGDGTGDGDSPSPSSPRPSPGGGGGGGGGGAGDDADPPRPPTPEPDDSPEPPPPEDPGEPPHEQCQPILEQCGDSGMGPDCHLEYEHCLCDIDLEHCAVAGEDPQVCHEQYEMCTSFDQPAPADPFECFDDYQFCALEVPAELCIGELTVCFGNYGGVVPEQCGEIASTCEAIGDPLQCDDVAFACESSIDPMMQCDYEFMHCMETAPPEAFDMCEGAYEECLAGLYGGPTPDEACWNEFDLCVNEAPGDPIVCEVELDACVTE